RHMGGEVPKELLYTFKDGTKSYLGAEIHHYKQWARIDFEDITRRFKEGKITWEQAKEEARKGLFKEKVVYKKTGKIKEDYQIIPQSIKNRSYVILAGGVHRGGAPLYKYSHPLIPDVESPTPKFKSYGIPKRGRAGREWYEKNFQNPFWREVYKREAYVIQNEINRRIRKGELSIEDAKNLWKEAQSKIDKEYQRRLSLKNSK
ncbi:hypothetical protein, partial [Fischerella thermalis]|uniref:hypothetical protein n=2 Tax=Fischerella thermalis TaxID=372787 RepID=UPI001CA49606